MQSAARGKWITEPSLKLALAALAIAAILFGMTAYLTIQDNDESSTSNFRKSTAQQSFLEANPRFLEMNALPEADTAGYAGRPAAQSLEHYRFLEMNSLPEARQGVPNYRFLDMNVLPGDDQVTDSVPIQAGRPS